MCFRLAIRSSERIYGWIPGPARCACVQGAVGLKESKNRVAFLRVPRGGRGAGEGTNQQQSTAPSIRCRRRFPLIPMTTCTYVLTGEVWHCHRSPAGPNPSMSACKSCMIDGSFIHGSPGPARTYIRGYIYACILHRTRAFVRASELAAGPAWSKLSRLVGS